MANVTIVAALLAGHAELSVALRAAAGAAVSRLSDRHVAGAASPTRRPSRGCRRETIVAALLFVLGFSTVFVALGASASAIGAVLRAYSGELAIVAGVGIIVMGLHFLGVDADRLADAREAARKSPSRSACGAPT